jgi:hypothetical protein
MIEEKSLRKLEAKILEEFPEASPFDAMVLSGFVALYCLAPEQIKEFLYKTIRDSISESQKMNKASMMNIESQMTAIEEGKVKEKN